MFYSQKDFMSGASGLRVESRNMAAEFIAEDGILKGLILTLNTGEEWTLGRDPDLCNLVIEDPKVSRRHAICRLTEGGYEIENLSETNPILINNHSVRAGYILRPGDRIKVGATVFRFQEGQSESPFDEQKGVSQTSARSSLFEDEESSVEMALAPKVYHEIPPIPDESSTPYETIFQEESDSGKNYINFDLTPSSRFLLKVITGPNSGAEVALDYNRSYIIGTDANVCDIVFHDLSISRQHAKLELNSEGELFIEDLGSRNGVLVDKERVTQRAPFNPNAIVILGTSSFLVLDREAPGETIVAPIVDAPIVKESESQPQEPNFISENEEVTPEPTYIGAAAEKVATKPFLSSGTLIITVILAGIALLFGIGMLSLFESKDVAVSRVDYPQEINQALKNFPAIKYTYNKSSGRLFLLGHVSSAIDKNELLYNLQGLNFITGIDDNVVVDEYIWQEMNILLAKNPLWKGISMHAPEPGHFVLTGYLKSMQDKAALTNYINLNFNYLDLLEDKVVVEEQLMNDVRSKLLQKALNGVTASITNGNLSLTGYIPSTSESDFLALVQDFKTTYGIRSVNNYVVSLSPEEAIVDLSSKYDVTGFSKFGNININVVINGRILARGDELDGMTITSIQPHTIFLEKDGLKYKIEYN